MKNIKLFSLLFVAAAMIFAGCTKETESVEPGGGEGEGTEEGLVYKEFKVGASENRGAKSRTELGPEDEQGNRSVLWKVGDEIRVFANVEGANADGYRFTVTETQDGGKTATISGEVANADKYYALYPYDAYNKTGGIIEGSNDSIFISANIPATQTVPVNGGYDPKACISVAYLGDGTSPSQFKLACGMIGLTFTSTDISIKELDVSFKDYSIIDDCMRIYVDNDEVVTKFNLISKSQNFKLTPDNSGGNFNNGVTYYVCLPSFKASQRIDIDFIEAESGAILTKSVTGQIQRAYLEKSPTLKLSDSDYNKKIATAEQFEYWYENEIDKYPKVILTDDIDMDNTTLIPKSFSGIFDGGGKTISNLIMKPSSAYGDNGLFSVLNDGCKVTNLTLKNLVISDGNNVGAICGKDNINNETYISGCNIIDAKIIGNSCGGIIGQCNNATIDGCVVENVTMSGGLLGGLVCSLNGADCIIKASYVTGELNGHQSGGFAYDWAASTAKLISCYSFTNLIGADTEKPVGYISVNGEPDEMLSSYYISNSIDEDGIKVIAIETLQNKVESLNNFLNSANSLYNYTKDNTGTDYSNPPLRLVKK